MLVFPQEHQNHLDEKGTDNTRGPAILYKQLSLNPFIWQIRASVGLSASKCHFYCSISLQEDLGPIIGEMGDTDKLATT